MFLLLIKLGPAIFQNLMWIRIILIKLTKNKEKNPCTMFLLLWEGESFNDLDRRSEHQAVHLIPLSSRYWLTTAQSLWTLLSVNHYKRMNCSGCKLSFMLMIDILSTKRTQRSTNKYIEVSIGWIIFLLFRSWMSVIT